jgi:hypothetical protein
VKRSPFINMLALAPAIIRLCRIRYGSERGYEQND